MIKHEYRAVLGVLGLAIVGQGIRVAVMPAGLPPGQIGLQGGGSAGRPLAHRDSAADLLRPLGPGEVVDVDREPASQIARVPGIGPRLAREIVADRQRHGSFGGLAGLDRVPRIGPGLLARIGPHVRFSGVPAGGGMGTGQEVPGATAPKSKPRIRLVPPGDPPGPVDLNTADSAGLTAIKGVGGRRAHEIVRWRELHGRFETVHDLARVPQLGERLASKIWREVHRTDP